MGPLKLALRLGVALLGALGIVGEARASDSDGAYGRFDGDVTLAGGLGVSLAKHEVGGAFGARALFLSTAGPWLAYADGFEQDGAKTLRSAAFGVSVAPLFPGRYASNLEQGPAFLDLMLDSVAIDLGAFFSESPKAGWAHDPGLDLGVSLSVPLGDNASGLFVDLRGSARWTASALGPGEHGDFLDRGASLTLMLAFHDVVATHLVDVFDRRPE